MSSNDRTSRLSADEAAFRLAELADTYADPGLNTFNVGGPIEEPARQAAYRLARALGYCRLYGLDGLDAGDLDGMLPPNVAMAASQHLRRWLDESSVAVAEFPNRFFNAAEDGEAEAVCEDMLMVGMDAWATSVAIDEAYHAALERSDSQQDAFAMELDQLCDANDRYQSLLHEQADLLSVVAESSLLTNWRASLAPPWGELLPWWLDGSLDAAARQVEANLAVLLPGARSVQQVGLSPPRLTPPALLNPAIAASTAHFMPGRTYGWESPDGKLQALLTLVAGAQEKVVLAFERCDSGELAAELQGQRVILGELPPQVVNPRGLVEYPLEMLRDAPATLRLEDESAAWRLVEL